MTPNVFSLEKEIALITGGGSGLGLGMAQCFIASGARVLITGRREDVLAAAVEQLGANAAYHTCDITGDGAAEQLLAAAHERFGAPSILINNAGIHHKALAVNTTIEDFQRVLETHVFAAHKLTRAVLPGMIERKHGSVIFLASMAALLGIPQVVAYSAAKSALVGMTRCLAAEGAKNGVRVNAIAPGWVHSPMLDLALRNDEARRNKILGRIMTGEFGQPEDVGWTAVFLCSAAAKYITGMVLPVDGGASIGF